MSRLRSASLSRCHFGLGAEMDAKIRARVLLAALSLFSQLSPGVWIRLFIVVSEVEFRRRNLACLPLPIQSGSD